MGFIRFVSMGLRFNDPSTGGSLFCRKALGDTMDCNSPGSSVHGIFQTRILEWVTIFYYKGSSQPRDRTHVSCLSCIGRLIFLLLVLPGKPIQYGIGIKIDP